MGRKGAALKRRSRTLETGDCKSGSKAEGRLGQAVQGRENSGRVQRGKGRRLSAGGAFFDTGIGRGSHFPNIRKGRAVSPGIGRGRKAGGTEGSPGAKGTEGRKGAAGYPGEAAGKGAGTGRGQGRAGGEKTAAWGIDF